MPGQARHDRAHVEVLDAAQARTLVGLAADASAPALASALRGAGADAVLVLGESTWLDTPHATGYVAADASLQVEDLARRWREFLSQGFVAPDAALLALRAIEGPLPMFTWGERQAVPMTATLPSLGLYAIVDSVPRLRQVLDAGIGTVQLRIKEPPDADGSWFAGLRSALREGVAACRDAGATLVVNDHWRTAAEVGAPAVHLGQEDLGRMAAQDLAALAGSRMALGVSSHAVWELARARALSPAYIACGPVWPTTTKDMPWRPQGLDNLAWWCRHAQHPVAAIGGILTAAQVREAARAGADSVCVVRGLGGDPRQAVPALREAFAQGRAEHVADVAPSLPHPSLEPTA